LVILASISSKELVLGVLPGIFAWSQLNWPSAGDVPRYIFQLFVDLR